MLALSLSSHANEKEFMFATSADPKTVEEMQELLEESIKGLVHYIVFTCRCCTNCSRSGWVSGTPTMCMSDGCYL